MGTRQGAAEPPAENRWKPMEAAMRCTASLVSHKGAATELVARGLQLVFSSESRKTQTQQPWDDPMDKAGGGRAAG